MADWSLMHRDWAGYYNPYQYQGYPLYHQQGMPVPQNAPPPQAQAYNTSQHSPALALLLNPRGQQPPPPPMAYPQPSGSEEEQAPKVESPRELRNKAEKQRRDKLNQSIAELASMVPPVVASTKKIDKTSVLRLTAHYLRAHQYVFCNKMVHSNPDFNPEFTDALLKLFNGFLITTTYRGIIVVVSKNVHQYLEFPELDLLGQNLVNLTHPKDRVLLLEQLKPKSQTLGPNGELLIPNEPDGVDKVIEGLRREKRSFIVRLKKQGPRSEPPKYVTCHIEGSFRKADGANHTFSRCCQVVRRSRTRGEAPESSGNDIVFIGVVRPSTDTFHSESEMEAFSMEYRTRHSVDGLIVQCEQRISLVTGYMTHEVKGVNAMNFMHRDDVRWVATALRDMYDHHRLFGESCYRLITKNGQFVYMKTTGYLDIDKDSKSVTTFVCTNTVVGEDEGKRLMKIMKKKISVMAKNNKLLKRGESSSNQLVPVEDPKQLIDVVMRMLTDLPKTSPGKALKPKSPNSPSQDLVIIPPKKERIVSGVEKIYTVFKNMTGDASVKITEQAPTWLVKEPPNTIFNFEFKNQPFFDKASPRILEIEEPKIVETFETPSTSTAACATTVQPDYVEPNKINVTSNVPMYPEAVNVEPYNPNYGFVIPEITFDTYFGENDTDLTLESFLCPDFVNENQIKYQLILDPESAKARSVQNNHLTVPSINEMHQYSLKRPSDYCEASSSKKKVMEAHVAPHDVYDNDFSCLESLFDDDCLNIQIETAIKSLEQTIDPSFPELLISSEVQEILGQIEEGQNEPPQ